MKMDDPKNYTLIKIDLNGEFLEVKAFKNGKDDSSKIKVTPGEDTGVLALGNPIKSTAADPTCYTWRAGGQQHTYCWG